MMQLVVKHETKQCIFVTLPVAILKSESSTTCGYPEVLMYHHLQLW